MSPHGAPPPGGPPAPPPSGYTPARPWGAAPVVAAPEPRPTTIVPVTFVPAPRRRGQHGAGTIVALLLLGVLALVAVAMIGVQVGVAALPGAAVLALIPLAAVLAAVLWIDRWEREPWQALAVAFGWGASVSVLVALVLNTGVMLAMVEAGSDATTATLVGAVVVAPVVEESIKALGVLLVFLAWRRSFDGPVDGLVYAATVAAGFAFVENILYFGSALALAADHPDAGQVVGTVFMMRAVMSPFAHVLFTACTGLALGLAAQQRNRDAWLWTLPVGLLIAIGLHGLWNGSALMGDGTGFVVLYVVLQVPLFLGAVGLAVWLRRREAVVVRDRLAEYAAAGWLAPVEVTMLASLGERRRARSWAAGQGGASARRAMGDFQASATRLAYRRQRSRRHLPDPRGTAEEMALLNDVGAARHAVRRSLAG